MILENRYRAAGTFAGPSYVARDADRLLLEAIQKNKRYPYIVAPRQSGKSSLLVRTRAALDPAKYLSAFVDLSTFDVGDYDGFWRSLLEEIAAATGLDPAGINPRRPEDILLAWLERSPLRLAVFIDEIDTLIGAAFCDQFFGKLRSLFNKRADKPAFERLMIVLAGAAHPARLIKDHMRSPFNVGLEIKLDDLTRGRVEELVSHLADSGATVGGDVAERLHARTGGSVYLSQLVLEKLWEVGEESAEITVVDVEDAITAMVAGAGSVIHFSNIYGLVANSLRLLTALKKLGEGRPIEERSAQDLRLAGISDGVTPFRNEVYRRVFGPGGPLDLVKLMPEPAAEAEQADDNETFGLLRSMADDDVSAFDGLQDLSAPAPAPAPPAPQKSELLFSLTPLGGASPPVLVGLEQAKERRAALDRAGLPTGGVDQEIQALRQDLRKGGQLRPGDSLGADRYKLLDRIGRGGFASVWKALDLQQNRDVAIKILHPNLAGDETRRQRFLEGARLMARLDHPVIARILRPLVEEEGFHFFVMELVTGGNLREAVLARRVGPERALAIVLRLGEALEYVHARGIVHRDVKPANVLLTADGEPKLTDFDIAADEEITGGTRTGALGTFVYAAPEMLDHAGNVDPRADVYGLGMTAIFCLQGKELPSATYRDIEPILKDLPCNDAVKRVLARAVDWERAERFEDAASFCKALRAAMAAPAAQVERREARVEEDAPSTLRGSVPMLPPMPAMQPLFAAPSAPMGAQARPPVPASRRSRAVIGLGVMTSGALMVWLMVMVPPLNPLSWMPHDQPFPALTSLASASPTTPITATVAAGYPIVGEPKGALGELCPSGMARVFGDRIDPFCLDQREVTVAAYDACLRADAGGCADPDPRIDTHCNRAVEEPMNCLTTTEAEHYCRWAGKRLPTVAEWGPPPPSWSGFRCAKSQERRQP